MIVLDTNVISEMMRASPSSAVSAWFARNPASLLFTTALNQAEILYGLALMPNGKRREDLFAAARLIFEEDMSGKVLAFDSHAATIYSDVAAKRRSTGKPISQIDAQIAAIVRSRGATLATRNIADFVDCGIELVDPWRL